MRRKSDERASDAGRRALSCDGAEKKRVAPANGAADTTFAKVVDAFAGDRDVTVGQKFGSTSLMRRGKVFATLMKGSFVAKLPPERVDELVEAGTGERLVMGKRVMKEWVNVAAARNRWVGLAREAHRFILEARKR